MEADERPTVLTLGYTGHTLEGLVGTLEEHGVRRVVDVRAVAESSIDGFSSDELVPALHDADIAYVHLGALGDLQPEAYERYMRSSEFSEAFEELERLTRVERVCLLCACEALSTCHLRLLAPKLRDAGLRVVHLTPAGPTEALTFDA